MPPTPEVAEIAPLDAPTVSGRAVMQSFNRPYPVTVPMVGLMALVPVYLIIAHQVRGHRLHAPALALDRWFPLSPAWALVYGALYLFLILLPVFVIREVVHIRRLFLAYLMVWLAAYACFLAYPTVAPRPTQVIGDGFAIWGLRFLYAADPPYNCFPSIHVAHSFVSAFACYPLHRGLGVFATCCAVLVGVSTLFTKQHYVLDVIAGVCLATVAAGLFLRRAARGPKSATDRLMAPALAICTAVVVGFAFGCYWAAYLFGLNP